MKKYYSKTKNRKYWRLCTILKTSIKLLLIIIANIRNFLFEFLLIYKNTNYRSLYHNIAIFLKNTAYLQQKIYFYIFSHIIICFYFRLHFSATYWFEIFIFSSNYKIIKILVRIFYSRKNWYFYSISHTYMCTYILQY